MSHVLIKKCIGLNKNEDTAYRNLGDTTKAVLREKCIALIAKIGKEGKSQINNLSSHLKKLERENQNKPKALRWKEQKETINKMKRQDRKSVV